MKDNLEYKLTLTGDVKDLLSFKNSLTGVRPRYAKDNFFNSASRNRKTPLNFHSIFPVPDELLKRSYLFFDGDKGETSAKLVDGCISGLEWEQRFWGTHLGPTGVRSRFRKPGNIYPETQLVYTFICPKKWDDGKISFLKRLGAHFPKIYFTIDGGENQIGVQQ